MFEKKITLGSSRRRSNSISRKKIFVIILFVILVFLSIWQVPIKQSSISKNIELPKPIEIK